MVRNVLTAIALLLVAAIVGACGGDDELSPEEYASALDDACLTLQNSLENIPNIQVDEGLSTEEANELGLEYAADFQAEVTGLEPPSDSADTAAEINELVTNPPTRDDAGAREFRAYYQQLERLFEDVGATGCAAYQELTLEALDSFSEPGGLFEAAPGD